jgi:hypothetical protein
LVEFAVAIAADGTVIGRPVAGLGLGDLFETWATGGDKGERIGVYVDAAQGAEIGEEIVTLGAGAFAFGHERARFAADDFVLPGAQEVEASCEVLQLNVVTALVAGEAAQGFTIG